MRRITMMLALLVLSLGLYAANVNPIATAFTNGNASALENNMDKEVDLSLPSLTKSCLGSEAIQLLSNFFSANKPSGFTVVHQAEKKTTGFYVGKLSCGQFTYRVNITYKIAGDSILIQSIRIE